MRFKVGVVVAAALSIAVWRSDAWAQGETNGAIAGTVRDTTGFVLPGVSVEVSSPALIEKVRTTMTDAQGQYRVVDLRPGVYKVTFTLVGFSTVERAGIELTTGFTATVNAELSVGSLQETIVVTGASPMVDIRNVRTQTVVTRQVLDTLPTGKDFAGFAISTPGADGGVASRSVGGVKGEGNYSLTLHGAGGGHTLQDGFMIDGVNGSGTGRGYQTSQTLIQEIVLYSVGSAETEAGGMNVNVVTKDGGNTFNGNASVAYANRRWQQSNLTDALRARGIRTPNRLNEIYDFGGGLGGPLRRDVVWFYGAARRWGAEERVAGLYFNKLPAGSLFYEPDLDKPAVAPNNYYDTSIKFTARLANHKVTFLNTHAYKCNCYIFLGIAGLNNGAGGAPFAIHTPEATNHSKATWANSPTRSVAWSVPVSNRLLLEAGLLSRNQDIVYERPDEVPASARSVVDVALGLEYGAKINGPNWLSEQGKGQQGKSTFRGAASYVTGSHALKVGFTHAWGVTRANAQPNYPVQYIFRDRVPIGLNQLKAPHTEDHRLRAQSAMFAQDQWTIRRLTLNMGLRFDYHNAYAPAQGLPPTEYTDAFTFDPVYNLPNWKDLSPRLGAAYDLFGNGRSAIKVSVNRYVVPDGLSVVQAVNPVNAIAATTSRTWNDLNRNYIPDCDLRNRAGNGECGPMSNQRFGTQIATTRYADDVLHGWRVRPNTWQVSAALEQQLWSGVSVTGAYYRTWLGNFRVTDNLAVSPSDYDQFCVTVPSDPRLPGGGGNQLCGLYDVKPSKFGQINNVVTQASVFGKQTQVYNGVDVTMNARFRGAGLLSGGVSFGRTSVNDCAVRPDSPENVFCDRTPPWNNETFVKLAGAYPLPWDLLASATFQNMPAALYQANVAFTNNQIAPSLGRNLAACGTAVVCSTTRTITVTQPGSLAEPRLNQLDVRLAKTLQVGRLRVQPIFDLYNAFNASPVLRLNNAFNARWPQPTDLLTGRLFKLGANIDF